MPSLITQNRDSRLELDLQESQLCRQRFQYRRNAARMSRSKTVAAGSSDGILAAAGDAWILRPLQRESSQAIRTSFQDASIHGSQLNVVQSLISYNTWRSPTNLPGVSVAADVIPTGIPAIVRRVPAGDSWSQTLAADAVAFPGPTLETVSVPMDRVIQGLITYPKDQGFLISFLAPSSMEGVDNLLTFYFGGPCDTNDVAGTYAGAGQFALNLRGSGQATLFEKDSSEDSGWATRLKFQWAEPFQVASNFHAIAIIPYDRDRILLIVGGSEAAIGPFPFSGNTLAAGPRNPQMNLYVHSQQATGYRKLTAVTGPGIIRCDIRRELRFPLILKKNVFPGGGTLVDGSFLPPHSLPDGTVMRLEIDKHLPVAEAVITATIFDAKTGVSLAQDGDGNWLSLAGIRPYYVVYDLTCSDNAQTPVLYGSNIIIDEVVQTRVPVTIYGRCRTVSISGPDLSPDQDSAHVFVSNDTTDALAILRTRARISAQITTTRSANPASPRVILFKGEVACANAERKGKTGRLQGLGGGGVASVYPSAQWHQYDIDLVGQWARLADQVSMSLQFYNVDQEAEPDPVTGDKPPWKITNIIKSLLSSCGVPDNQTDVPDNDLRLWPSERNGDVDLYVVQPGVSFVQLIQRLAQDYLGQIMLYDPNAGPLGMWRLIDNPQAPYTTKFEFFSTAPPAGSVYAENCFGPNTAFVKSYHTKPEPPEANLIWVIGAGGVLSNDQGQTSVNAVLRNPLSYDADPANPTADPTSPDYLGREVPLFWVDTSFGMGLTPGDAAAAVSYLCRRLYNQVAHGRQWLTFYAPLALITDATDEHLVAGRGARPLRVNDVIEFNGVQFLLRSVNPDIKNNMAQMANYEALRITDG